MKNNFQNKSAKVVFVLPTLLIFTLVVFYSIIQTFVKSFYEWDGINVGNFLFFKNYIELFHDDVFYLSLFNGLKFTAVLVAYQVGLGLVLALIMSDKKIKFSRFFRSSFFIPVVLSVTVVSQLWLAIMHGEFGLINKLSESLGMSFRQDWLNNEKWAIYIVALSNAWQYLGVIFILFYSSIKSIPEHYFEAAIIDGASKVKTHIHITIPLLSEAFKFCMVSAVSGGINSFTQSFMITSGGPGKSTYTLTYMMFNSAFREQNFGYGCAAAAALIIEGVLAMYIINKLIARERIIY